MSIVDSKEVVRIVVKKFDGKMQPESKKLCVDPQLTSFENLQHLLVKAFNIKTDFAIYYQATDNTGQNVYLSLLSDWDLDAAFYGASTPHLSLKVELKPFEDDTLDEDWDVVTSGDLSAQQQETANLSSSLKSFVNRKVSEVIRAIGLHQEEVKDFKPQKPPMSDAEFHNFLDAVGHLIQPQQFRISVYQGGVEPSLRRVVWRHLLNVYPDNMTGRERFDYLTNKSKEYYRLRDHWYEKDSENIQHISNMVRKDVLRTDRQHPFFAGADENQNIVSLFNLLVTYSLTHPAVGYCQGMSDLASPLLVIEKDEAHAYICFCALMKRLETNFSADGLLMTTKFEHLSLLLQHYDPVFADYLKEENADMFFCYRWILLEMKREFPLDDAFYMLEVMWSTLPLDPPDMEIALVDPAYLEGGVMAVSPPVGNYIQLRTKRRISVDQENAAAAGSPSNAQNAEHMKNRSLGDSQLTRRRSKEKLTTSSGGSDQPISKAVHCHPLSSSLTSQLSGITNRSSSATHKSPSTPDRMHDSPILSSVVKDQSSAVRDQSSAVKDQLSAVKDQSSAVRDQLSAVKDQSSAVRDQSSVVKDQSPAVTECSLIKTGLSPNQTDSLHGKTVQPLHLGKNLLGSGEEQQQTRKCSTTSSISVVDSGLDQALALTEHENLSGKRSSKAERRPASVVLSDNDEADMQSVDLSSCEEADEGTHLLDPAFVNVSEAERLVQLPPPIEFGCGNPFLMFLCLALLLEHRDHVMTNRMDYNEIAVFFDRMVRKHDAQSCVHQAKSRYALYLRHQQQIQAEAADV